MAGEHQREEQDWLNIYRDIRSDLQLEAKKRVLEKRAEYRAREELHDAETKRLMEERERSVEEATSGLVTERDHQVRELRDFLDNTNALYECARAREPFSHGPVHSFLNTVDAHPDLTKFFASFLLRKIVPAFAPEPSETVSLDLDRFETALKDIFVRSPSLFRRIHDYVTTKIGIVERDYENKIRDKSRAAKLDYESQIANLQQRCTSESESFRKERGAILEDVAEKIAAEMHSIFDIVRQGRLPQQPERIAIYRGLFSLQQGTAVDFDDLDPVSLDATVEAMMREGAIGGERSMKLRSFLSTIRRYEQKERQNDTMEEIPMGRIEREPVDRQARYARIFSIVGDEETTGLLVTRNPQIMNLGDAKFVYYTRRLEETVRRARENGVIINERFGSLQGLDEVEHGLLQRDQSDAKEKVLGNIREYNPKVVEAIIVAFKPGTLNFIGNNYLPLKHVHKNVRPHLDELERTQVDDHLARLVSMGLILKHKGREVYSLNPHHDSVEDPALRELLKVYLTKAKRH